jgi:NDP-sugar pyrophosphorylase family protein
LKAGIIAAGDGSRLKSEGVLSLKPLVEVQGVPLIERLIRSYIGSGVEEIVCIVNESSLEVKRFVESKGFSAPVKFVVQTTPSSMHSLFALAPHLEGGRFLLSTVDSIFNAGEFGRFLEYARSPGAAEGVLAVTNFVDDENPLYVKLDPSWNILSFGRKSEQPGGPAGPVTPRGPAGVYGGGRGAASLDFPWVTGGLYVLSPRVFSEMDAVLKLNVGRLRNFLAHLVNQGYRLEGYPFSRIVDVDHADDIRAAEELLRTA